jgi:hypothetical protein
LRLLRLLLLLLWLLWLRLLQLRYYHVESMCVCERDNLSYFFGGVCSFPVSAFAQAGMLPLEPAAVVPAGREVTFAAVANSLVLVDGFAWRLLPMVSALHFSFALARASFGCAK